VNKEKIKNYIFENDLLHYESFINEFTHEIFKEFDSKAEKLGLISKIEDLFAGNKVNYTEDLAAWHPRYREENKSIDNTFTGAEIFEKVKNIITIGIGGSFEGPKLLIESLVGSNSIWNQIFITGSDSSEFQEKTKNLDPKKTLFIVSSKSFTTEEILATLNEAIKWSGSMDRFIAITANKSEASKYKIKHILEFNKEIGGRYSIWSDISLSAFYELDEFKRSLLFLGGHRADLDLKENEDYLKFIKTLAYSDIWLHNFKNKTSRAVLSYSWKLRSFPDYVQQLEMESLGKPASKEAEFKKTGQIIFGGYGPTAQHSYFQLLHQGTQEICADFIVSKEDPKSLSYAQAITQTKLLSNGADDLSDEKERINGNIPVNLFLLNKVDPFTLGYLIATWEHRTYITAAMLKINPFDQFGVSAGKIYTKKYQTDKD
tara:strand:+ start:3735 stop:5027 length:1293 start_codon:yes stop_codon:yes gene_type:complete